MLKAIIKKAQSFNHSTKLILLVVQFLTGPPAYAATATYTFPSNLPPGCTTVSTGIYTCAAITLNAYETIAISSPSTITVNSTLIAGIFSKINSGTGGLPPTLNLVVNAAIGLGSNSILNANVTSTAAINIGADSTGSGSITTAIGAVTLGAGVKFAGDITTGTGAITVGAGSVLDNLKTTDVGAITVGASATIGSITTNTGTANLGAGSVVARSISTEEGIVTLGANVNVAGSVTTVIGSINVGADSIICGDISTKTGVITVGARVQVGGNVSSKANAITTGANSTIGGSVSTPGVQTFGAGMTADSGTKECAGKKINICENNVDKKIDAVIFKNTQEGLNHYLSQCNAPVCETPGQAHINIM